MGATDLHHLNSRQQSIRSLRGGLFSRRTTGARAVRRLLLLAMVAELALGWLRWRGEAIGLFTSGVGVVLFVLGNGLVLIGLASWTARSLDAIEAQRQAAEDERNRLFEISPDLICTAGEDGFLRLLNPAWKAALGYSFEELRSRPYLEFVHPEDLQATRHSVANRFTGDPAQRSFENRICCKDGSYRWMLWNSTAVPEQELLFAIGRDNTERHRADDRLKASATELTRSNAELDQFAYVASHDLQEPLRGVVGCVQLLHRRYAAQLDAPAGELIQHAIDGVNRMQRLIADLLAYSRVSNRDLAFEPVDLAQVLRHVRADLAAAIAESGASITEEPLPTLRVDPLQMGQLLQNLIGNAIKYRAETAPAIHVGARRGAGEWILSVRDNGIGFDPQYAERIFRIFQRLHSRVKFAGTGIGLAICQKIVQRHGGRIWAQAQPGAGATFFFTLPDRS